MATTARNNRERDTQPAQPRRIQPVTRTATHFPQARTTRHAGYAVSQQRRKRVEESFGWGKTVGLLRKLRHRGRELVDWIFTFTMAAYNLVRLRTLLRVELAP